MTPEAATQVNRLLLDLQDMTEWAGTKDWVFKGPKLVNGVKGGRPVEMWQVWHGDKLVLTLGLEPGDAMTRMLIENLLLRGHALIAGASLTMQMYVASEEVQACQTMKEQQGLTDAYRDRNQSAWNGMRTLLSKIRTQLRPLVGVGIKKPAGRSA